ncbi:gfo/Idh/MocA family oxidoreductase, partial [Candidatus Poribacteria bacterium]|nr:gfo/Idh/MocA family oxidoreductase [Candidatus Poribacteria bacterium]
RGEMLPCDMDDNTFILLDFGEAFFGFIYGAAAGHAIRGGLAINGTTGSIEGSTINGNPIDAPKRELPHVVGPHRNIQEAHVYEDIMQLVDWIREDKPSIVTAEHARHVIEIFDAGYRSAQTGEAYTLRTTF